VAGRITGDVALQGLLVDSPVLLADLGHVNVAAGEDHADELVLVGPHAVHGLKQPLGVVLGWVLDRLHDGQQTLLEVERGLSLDRVDDVVVTHLLVRVKHDPQLAEIPGGQDLDEDVLVGPDLVRTGLEEGGGVGLGLLHIDPVGLVAVGRQEGLEQVAVVT